MDKLSLKTSGTGVINKQETNTLGSQPIFDFHKKPSRLERRHRRGRSAVVRDFVDKGHLAELELLNEPFEKAKERSQFLMEASHMEKPRTTHAKSKNLKENLNPNSSREIDYGGEQEIITIE